MNKIEIQNIAKSLMLEIKDEEIADVSRKFDLFLQQVDHINLIDTKGVATLDYPFEQSIGKLRDDIEGKTLSVKEVLSNTDNVSDNMVKIPKVVV